MNELIDQITQKTGISQDQAQQAVQTVTSFLKQKLPGPIASQVENVLGGQSMGGQGLGGMMGQGQQELGGMFGGNQPNIP